MAVAIGFTDFFLSIVNVEGEIYDLAETYFRIVVALPFIFLKQITAGIYRGWEIQLLRQFLCQLQFFLISSWIQFLFSLWIWELLVQHWQLRLLEEVSHLSFP